MNSDPKDSFESTDPQTSVDMLMAGVLEVATAALGVSAVLAKTLAQETARGNPVPEPEGRGSPLNVVVHYGVAAVTNVVKLVVSGVGVTTNETANQSAEPTRSADAVNRSPNSVTRRPATPSVANLPTVHCGSTLRIPLSIENPGSEPMDNMMITCLSLDAVTEGIGQMLDQHAIRFQPETLSIAPKDFEKLTVFIETQPETVGADYTAIIGIGAEGFETTLNFRVIAAQG